LKSRRAPCTSPGPNVLGYVLGVGAAAGNSNHFEEERVIYMNSPRSIRFAFQAQDITPQSKQKVAQFQIYHMRRKLFIVGFHVSVPNCHTEFLTLLRPISPFFCRVLPACRLLLRARLCTCTTSAAASWRAEGARALAFFLLSFYCHREPERSSLSLCYPLHCWWCWRVLPAEICTRYDVQTTTPSGLGTSGNGW
jgi:hypothetical protein